jgi:hypothetical protein
MYANEPDLSGKSTSRLVPAAGPSVADAECTVRYMVYTHITAREPAKLHSIPLRDRCNAMTDKYVGSSVLGNSTRRAHSNRQTTALTHSAFIVTTCRRLQATRHSTGTDTLLTTVTAKVSREQCVYRWC